MKIFIDTANIEEIKDAVKLGVVDGVTTNPTIIAKEKRVFKEVIKEISQIVDGDISAEVTTETAEEMYKEAKELSKIHKNIVIKLPMTKDGIITCKKLTKEGIKTNITLVFSANQALIAAKAGATYVSPFLGRLDDIGSDGMILIEDILTIFKNYDIKTQIIAASIRHPLHVLNVAKAGAHVATLPYKVIMQMLNHPLTDKGMENFRKDIKIINSFN